MSDNWTDRERCEFDGRLHQTHEHAEDCQLREEDKHFNDLPTLPRRTRKKRQPRLVTTPPDGDVRPTPSSPLADCRSSATSPMSLPPPTRDRFGEATAYLTPVSQEKDKVIPPVLERDHRSSRTPTPTPNPNPNLFMVTEDDFPGSIDRITEVVIDGVPGGVVHSVEPPNYPGRPTLNTVSGPRLAGLHNHSPAIADTIQTPGRASHSVINTGTDQQVAALRERIDRLLDQLDDNTGLIHRLRTRLRLALDQSISKDEQTLQMQSLLDDARAAADAENDRARQALRWLIVVGSILVFGFMALVGSLFGWHHLNRTEFDLIEKITWKLYGLDDAATIHVAAPPDPTSCPAAWPSGRARLGVV